MATRSDPFSEGDETQYYRQAADTETDRSRFITASTCAHTLVQVIASATTMWPAS